MGGQHQSSQKSSQNAETGQVFYVSSQGVARPWLDESPAVTNLKKKKREEAARLKAVRISARVPKECGPAMVKLAPARGPVVPFVPTVMLPDGAEGYKAVRLGYRGRSALRSADAFDKMCAQTARRKGAVPFSRQQIGVGRDYAALTERCVGAGMKCSNLLASGGGSAGGSTDPTAFMDAFLRDQAQLRRYHRAIGSATGLAVRRVRPSARGALTAIPDRALVDRVCIGEQTLTEVLGAFDWIGNGRNIKSLRAALCAVLDRMTGC